MADHITWSGFACWILAAQQCASEYVNHLNAGGYFAMALQLHLQLIWNQVRSSPILATRGEPANFVVDLKLVCQAKVAGASYWTVWPVRIVVEAIQVLTRLTIVMGKRGCLIIACPL